MNNNQVHSLQDFNPHSGDYCYCKIIPTDHEYLFIKSEAVDAVTACHACYELKEMTLHYGKGLICSDEDIAELRPATNSEVKILNNALLSKGVKWNAERKCIVLFPRKAKLNFKF